MAVKVRGVADSILLSVALVGGSLASARAQQPEAAAELPTIEVVGEADSNANGTGESTRGRATASSPGPVVDYVASDSRVGTKTDTPLMETPQSITVVGDEQMRDQGVQTLQEAVRYAPGVFADSFGLDSRGDNVTIRGIPAAYFLDGLRTTYGYNSTTAPIEPYALERVEVLRGPASMLYGQSSIGGLVNGVSKMPLAEFRHEIIADYGSFDFKQLRFDTTGPMSADGKWLYRVVGLARDADTQVDYVDNDRLMLAPSITYRPSNDTSITVLANIRDDHSGSTAQFLPQIGSLYPNKFGQRADFSTFVGEPDDHYDTQQRSVTALFDHEFDNGLKLHNSTRYTYTDNDYQTHYPAILTPGRIETLNGAIWLLGGSEFLNPADSPFVNSGQSEIARAVTLQSSQTRVFNSDTNLTGNFQTGAFEHKVLAGFDYTRYSTEVSSSGTLLDNVFPALPGFGLPAQPRFDMYNPVYGQSNYLVSLNDLLGGGNPFIPANAIPMMDLPEEIQAQTGIYVQDQIRLGQWIGTFGLRQDWLTIEQQGSPDESLDNLSGRAALMYETSFGFNPYISYSTAFTPLPGQPVGTTIFTPFTDTSPAKPMEGEQIEIGFKYQHPTLPFMVSAAVYDLTQTNQIVQPDFLQQAVQGADVRVRGFEIEAAGEVLPGLKLIASYSYTDAKYDKYPEILGIPAGISDFMEGKPVDGIPTNMASLWGVYAVQSGALSGFSFGGGVRYIGSSTSYGLELPLSVPPTPALPLEEIVVETPSYTLFDAMIAYQTEHWRFQVTGQNLADKYYVTSCSAYRGDCGVGQARTVIASLTYKF